MVRKGTDAFIRIKDIEEALEAAAQTTVEVVRQAAEGEAQVQPVQA